MIGWLILAGLVVAAVWLFREARTAPYEPAQDWDRAFVEELVS